MQKISEIKSEKLHTSKWYKSKSGYQFDFYANEWRLDGTTVIYFKRLIVIDDDVTKGFRLTLCRYAEELSAMHTFNMFNRFNACMKTIDNGKLTLQGITDYRGSFDADNEYKLGALKGFLLAWYEWGFKGTHFPKDVILYAVFFYGFCRKSYWK